MKRFNQAAVAILGATLAGSAFARYQDSYFDYARVLSVNPIAASQTSDPVTREECWDEPTQQFHPGSTAQRQLPPQVDDRTGQVITRTETVQEDGYYTRASQQHCRTRTEMREQPVIAYDVVYSYGHQDYHDRIAHDPGSRVRVHVDNGYVEIAE